MNWFQSHSLFCCQFFAEAATTLISQLNGDGEDFPTVWGAEAVSEGSSRSTALPDDEGSLDGCFIKALRSLNPPG